MAYAHTQTGWPVRLAFGLAALVFLALTAVQPLDRPLPHLMLFAGAAVAVALGLAWGAMTIRLDSDRLHWSFGPGWPRFELPLAAVRSVDVTRTAWWDGWGIHRTRRGWLYNVGGRDAVLITRTDGKGVLLGTDEPRRLKSAIERARARKAGR